MAEGRPQGRGAGALTHPPHGVGPATKGVRRRDTLLPINNGRKT